MCKVLCLLVTCTLTCLAIAAMEIKHTTDSRLDLFLRFEEWFKSKGSDLKQSKLQFSCDLPEGNGLVATDPIKVRTGFFLMSGNTIPIISNVNCKFP